MATTAKISVRVRPWAAPASTPPMATPISMGMSQRRSRVQSTTPFLSCACIEEKAVGMMVASEVPMARCIRTPSSTPIRLST